MQAPKVKGRPVQRPAPFRSLAARGALLLALALLPAGCSEKLTPARAGTVIRHSKAFLSGAPASDPIFDGVSSLRMESVYGEDGDSCLAEFSYHWPPDPRTPNSALLPPALTARVYLRRFGGSWAVDDERSRTLVPSWPQLPRTPNPFSDAAPGLRHLHHFPDRRPSLDSVEMWEREQVHETFLLWRKRTSVGDAVREVRCLGDHIGEDLFELRLQCGHELLLSEPFEDTKELLARAEELQQGTRTPPS